MSDYNRLDPDALDRWITGNYGEDREEFAPEPEPLDPEADPTDDLGLQPEEQAWDYGPVPDRPLRGDE